MTPTNRGTSLNPFTYRVFWSPEDEAYVGNCAEFPSVSHLDSSHERALRGIKQLVEAVVVDLQSEGEPIPEALAARRYSGAFKVRVPPSLHQRLVIEAAEQGVSLNRLASSKLSA